MSARPSPWCLRVFFVLLIIIIFNLPLLSYSSDRKSSEKDAAETQMLAKKFCKKSLTSSTELNEKLNSEVQTLSPVDSGPMPVAATLGDFVDVAVDLASVDQDQEHEKEDELVPFQLNNLVNSYPITTREFGFGFAFIDRFNFNEEEASFLVKGPSKDISRALKVIIVHLLKGSKTKKKKLENILKEADLRFQSSFAPQKKKGFLRAFSEKEKSSYGRGEEIAYFHYIGEKEINAQLLARKINDNVFQLSVRRDPRSIHRLSEAEWTKIAKKYHLFLVPQMEGIRVPSRLLADEKGSFNLLLQTADAFLWSYRANGQNREEGLLLSKQINGINQRIIKDIFKASIHQKIGQPGKYQFFEKDFSLGLILELEKESEKEKGRVSTVEDLVQFVLNFESKSWKQLIGKKQSSIKLAFVQAIESEFKQLEPYTSRPSLYTITLHLKHPLFKKRFVANISFHYQYQIISNERWQTTLVGGNRTIGGSHDIFITLGPDLKHSKDLITSEEIKIITDEIQAGFQVLLEKEKRRNNNLR